MGSRFGRNGSAMIYYVTTERFSSTIRYFLRGFPEARQWLKSLTYEELFFERAGPIGHYIFTDFDRLSRYELECLASFAASLEKSAPEAQILNHPLRVLERLPLLVALKGAGINDFTATRIDCGERPPRYPAFIRAEDGYGGPETDVLLDDAAFDLALAELRQRGLPLRGRISVGYAGERGVDGFFRKYGAFNIAGRILPHHIQRNRGWVVKKDIADHDWTIPRDRTDRLTEIAVAEEFDFVRDNPHRQILAKAFSIAGIDFGRVDYGIVAGRVQIYEINTNPSLPGQAKSDQRDTVRAVTRPRMIEALRALDTPPLRSGRIRFTERRPKAHDSRMPRWRLPASLARRFLDYFRFRNDQMAASQD